MKCPFSKVVFLCTVTLATLQIRRLSNKKQQQQNSSEDKEDDDNKVEEETNEMSTSSSKSKVEEKEEEKYPVVFVLGGPGAGKGTQCELLSKRLEGGDVWAHFSAGDLLRAERKKSNSEIGNLINEKIQNGQIVPAEITVQLLQNAMTSATSTHQKKKKFLIDGFPRSDGNVTVWNQLVENVQAETKFVLFLDCPEDEMMERILERGKTSGRNDDNVETLRKRFQTFRKESMPIVEMYGEKVKKVKADRDIEEVYSDVAKLFEGI